MGHRHRCADNLRACGECRECPLCVVACVTGPVGNVPLRLPYVNLCRCAHVVAGAVSRGTVFVAVAPCRVIIRVIVTPAVGAPARHDIACQRHGNNMRACHIAPRVVRQAPMQAARPCGAVYRRQAQRPHVARLRSAAKHLPRYQPVRRPTSVAAVGKFPCGVGVVGGVCGVAVERQPERARHAGDHVLHVHHHAILPPDDARLRISAIGGYVARPNNAPIVGV